VAQWPEWIRAWTGGRKRGALIKAPPTFPDSAIGPGRAGAVHRRNPRNRIGSVFLSSKRTAHRKRVRVPLGRQDVLLETENSPSRCHGNRVKRFTEVYVFSIAYSRLSRSGAIFSLAMSHSGSQSPAPNRFPRLLVDCSSVSRSSIVSNNLRLCRSLCFERLWSARQAVNGSTALFGTFLCVSGGVL
jgi:hypothetical protein